MKQILILLAFVPVLALSQDTKNVITVSRYFPKVDKGPHFEKALAAHVQKFHKGDQAWTVFSIESGPDAGGYQIVEGPNNWDGFDKRGDLGKAHTDDWNINVQPLLTERYSNLYATFRQDLSTVMQTDYAEKIAINHLYYKPGFYGDMENLIRELKNTWVESEQFVAVYEASSSGDPQFILVYRYKNGLKDRIAANRPAFPVLFAKANGGESAWNRYLANYRQAVSHQWSELMFQKKALGTAQ